MHLNEYFLYLQWSYIYYSSQYMKMTSFCSSYFYGCILLFCAPSCQPFPVLSDEPESFLIKQSKNTIPTEHFATCWYCYFRISLKKCLWQPFSTFRHNSLEIVLALSGPLKWMGDPHTKTQHFQWMVPIGFHVAAERQMHSITTIFLFCFSLSWVY